MKGVILDVDSLGPGDLDLSPVLETLDDWALFPATRADEIVSRIEGADVVLTNKIPLSRDAFEQSTALKFVSILATGFNHIDLDAAKGQGVTVSNVRAYATPSVVQHTISLMLALATNLTAYVEAVRGGRWQQSDVFCFLDFPVTELAGKTLGIVGYGELGQGVARVAEAFGMEVLISARPVSAGADATASSDRVPFHDVLERSDFLSLHCPLTEDTHHLIDAGALSRMKPSACLINTARGALIDPDALLAALAREQIAGAALDVIPVEPPLADDKLVAAASDRLLITPHSAWGALETRRRLVGQTRENIDGFLSGQPVRTLT